MMQLSRRGMLKVSASSVLLYFVASASSLLIGCSFSSVFSAIQSWIPIGLNAFNSVLLILEGAGLINPVEGSAIAAFIAVIKAGFAQLSADVEAYQAITPPPAGALAKIEAVMGVIVSNFQAFLTSIKVSDSTIINLVVGLVQIILSTIAGFQAALPSAASGKVSAMAPVQFGGTVIAVVPKRRSRKQFAKDFNAVCVQFNHPEAEIH